MICKHTYLIPSGDKCFCLNCKQYIDKPKEEDSHELVIPPRIYKLSPQLWESVRPWKTITTTLATSFGWYITLITMEDYLIMPIYKNGQMVFYSARRLTGRGMKYLYPTGVQKKYFQSSDTLVSPIFICEGVADAVYMSQFGSSIAVLGSYYDGSLDSSLLGHDCYIVFDGDAAGMVAGIRLASQIKAKMIVLPNGKDPTDLSISEMKELVCQYRILS